MPNRELVVVAVPVISAGGGIRHCAAVARSAADAGWKVEVLVAGPAAEGSAAVVRLAAPDAEVRFSPTSRVSAALWLIAKVLVIEARTRRRGGVVYYTATPQASLLVGPLLGVCRSPSAHAAVIQGDQVDRRIRGIKRAIYTATLRFVLSHRRTLVATVAASHAERVFEMLKAIPKRPPFDVGNVAFEVGDAPWIAGSGFVRAPEEGRLAVIARLTPEKGVDRALHALQHLPRNYRLHIYGDGPERPRLEALAVSLRVGHRVTFHGWVPASEALASAAVVVIPSESEGFSLVALEAAWAECPVVVLSEGGVLEVAGRMKNVRCAPATDPPALARGIRAAHAESFAERDLRPELTDRWREFSLRVTALLEHARRAA
jgi:glycosyltransferase involved in cell wall biosynthesis